MALKPFDGRLIDLLEGQALTRDHGEEMANQIGNILGALAQRWQAQRYYVQAEEQIFAKQALLDELAQILVGRGDDAHIRFNWSTAADSGVFALLQHAQKASLRFHWHVADFVEEKRTAFGLLEASGAARVGAGEGPLLVTEQLRLDEV